MCAQARVGERGVGGSGAEPTAAASSWGGGTGAHGLWPEQRHCRGWAAWGGSAVEGTLLASLGSSAPVEEGLLGLRDISCLSSALAGTAVAAWEWQEWEYGVTGAHASCYYGVL